MKHLWMGVLAICGIGWAGTNATAQDISLGTEVVVKKVKKEGKDTEAKFRRICVKGDCRGSMGPTSLVVEVIRVVTIKGEIQDEESLGGTKGSTGEDEDCIRLEFEIPEPKFCDKKEKEEDKNRVEKIIVKVTLICGPRATSFSKTFDLCPAGADVKKCSEITECD